MRNHETFGQCLQRVLTQTGTSASEASRLVNFRSRNSIFRILGDQTGAEVDARFLEDLRHAMGDAWPQQHWDDLTEALEIKRVGFEQHISNRLFFDTLYGTEPQKACIAIRDDQEYPLAGFLKDLVAEGEYEVIMTGRCHASLSRELYRGFAEAGDEGRLTIRHYIDADEKTVVRNFLGVLPLMSRPWYNARLVDHQACPREMLALYRVSAIFICRLGAGDEARLFHMLRYDDSHYLCRTAYTCLEPMVSLLDRWRYDLDILKPNQQGTGEEAFIGYTANLAQLESECTILSVKPDIHFNCVPSDVLRPAIIDGFAATGMVDQEALGQLMTALEEIHESRYTNMVKKRSATHLVYSLPAMERFMQTGVQTDHFFLQRAYTMEERRAIIRMLLDTMHSNPAFNVHFLREDAPALRNEITLYKGKGVLLLDAYSDYDLNANHSEAVITQQAFMDRFYRFFMDELLQKHVMSRSQNIAVLERLLLYQ